MGQANTGILECNYNLTTQTIADTGATYIFIMDSVEVVNKCLAHKPLVINMSDGQQMQSTHIAA